MSSRFTNIPKKYSIEPGSDDPIQKGGLNIPRKIDIYYIDVNVTYKQDLKGLIVYDEDVINRQIANIFATPVGSDQFEPSFGSNVPYRLQDPITPITAQLLFNDTIGALGIWMEDRGRITLSRSNSFVRPIANDPDNEGYEINMYYSTPRTRVLSSFNAFLLR